MKNRLFRRTLQAISIALFLYFIAIFLHGWLTDWQPAEGPSPLTLTHSSAQTTVTDSILHFVLWNVGYGGLGAESDFFYDDEGIWYSGSSMVRSPKESVEKNLRGATDFLKNTQADFFLLQEVDVESARSHSLRQYDAYAQALPDFAATFAPNYQCDRVPIPLLEPDPDVLLDLGAVVASVYERGGYDARIDYHAPVPPPNLREDENAWVKQLLNL